MKKFFNVCLLKCYEVKTEQDTIIAVSEIISLLCCMEFDKYFWLVMTFKSYMESEVRVMAQECHCLYKGKIF